MTAFRDGWAGVDGRSLIGVARSVVMYRLRPFQNRRLRAFYRTMIAPGDLCFDIGAHVGNRSLAMAAAGASVVAVEPQPHFLAFLDRFVRSRQIEVVGGAVGSVPGRTTLHVSRLHPTVTTMSSDWIGEVRHSRAFGRVRWDRQVTVDVTTLDALIERYGMPHFCKIDVEGLEAEILEGLSRPLALVAFEYVPESLSTAHACLDRLDALGRYEYNIVRGERHRFHDAQWVDSTALRRTLKTVAPGGGPGDIYGRLLA